MAQVDDNVYQINGRPVGHTLDRTNFNWDDISRKSSCEENGAD